MEGHEHVHVEVDEKQTAWDEVRADVEAALFAANDLPVEMFDGDARIKAIVGTKLEEALLWLKRGIEKGAPA